jgi:hypothetical protein
MNNTTTKISNRSHQILFIEKSSFTDNHSNMHHGVVLISYVGFSLSLQSIHSRQRFEARKGHLGPRAPIARSDCATAACPLVPPPLTRLLDCAPAVAEDCAPSSRSRTAPPPWPPPVPPMEKKHLMMLPPPRASVPRDSADDRGKRESHGLHRRAQLATLGRRSGRGLHGRAQSVTRASSIWEEKGARAPRWCPWLMRTVTWGRIQ